MRAYVCIRLCAYVNMYSLFNLFFIILLIYYVRVNLFTWSVRCHIIFYVSPPLKLTFFFYKSQITFLLFIQVRYSLLLLLCVRVLQIPLKYRVHSLSQLRTAKMKDITRQGYYSPVCHRLIKSVLIKTSFFLSFGGYRTQAALKSRPTLPITPQPLQFYNF